MTSCKNSLLFRICSFCPKEGPEHVSKYHEWMKDPNLLDVTGSEPLSYDEEVEMQQSWRDDPKKCTFIVLAKDLITDDDIKLGFQNDFVTTITIAEHISAMVGDVNLFLSDIDDDVDEEHMIQHGEGVGNQNKKAKVQAEIDIMIAERDYQRKGLGRAATCTMLLYGARNLDIVRFFCKIKESNHGSIEMFKSLGFQQCAYAECFKEVELELKFKSVIEIETLLGQYGQYKVISCPQ